MYLSKHGFNVDGQVSMGAAVPPHYTEAQAIRSSLQIDAFILRGAEANTENVVKKKIPFYLQLHNCFLLCVVNS